MERKVLFFPLAVSLNEFSLQILTSQIHKVNSHIAIFQNLTAGTSASSIAKVKEQVFSQSLSTVLGEDFFLLKLS